VSAALDSVLEDNAFCDAARVQVKQAAAHSGSAGGGRPIGGAVEDDFDDDSPLANISFAMPRPCPEQSATMRELKVADRISNASMRSSIHTAQRSRRRLAHLVPAAVRVISSLQAMGGIGMPVFERSIALLSCLSSEIAAVVWHADAIPHSDRSMFSATAASIHQSQDYAIDGTVISQAIGAATALAASLKRCGMVLCGTSK